MTRDDNLRALKTPGIYPIENISIMFTRRLPVWKILLRCFLLQFKTTEEAVTTVSCNPEKIILSKEGDKIDFYTTRDEGDRLRSIGIKDSGMPPETVCHPYVKRVTIPVSKIYWLHIA